GRNLPFAGTALYRHEQLTRSNSGSCGRARKVGGFTCEAAHGEVSSEAEYPNEARPTERREAVHSRESAQAQAHSVTVTTRPGDPVITPALIAEHGLTTDEY